MLKMRTLDLKRINETSQKFPCCPRHPGPAFGRQTLQHESQRAVLAKQSHSRSKRSSINKQLLLEVRNQIHQTGPRRSAWLVRDRRSNKSCRFHTYRVIHLDTAHQEGGVVFVHCALGKSRSVSSIIMYLMNYRNMSYD